MTKYFFDISAGRLSGLRRHYKFGKNPDIDAKQTGIYTGEAKLADGQIVEYEFTGVRY